MEYELTSSQSEKDGTRVGSVSKAFTIVGTMGRNLPNRITSMERADNGKEIDPKMDNCLRGTRNWRSSLIYRRSMNEAIENWVKFCILQRKDYIQLLSEAFQMEVAAQGVTYD